jgi:hypothetical protein
MTNFDHGCGGQGRWQSLSDTFAEEPSASPTRTFATLAFPPLPRFVPTVQQVAPRFI